MQQLHLVGFTADLDSLIFSTRKGAKSGSFVLPLDESLLSVIAEAVRRRNAEGAEIDTPVELSPTAAMRRQSQLSPREIQDRLRAGRSLDDVAAEAGVGEEWVARFAAPVVAERSQVVARLRQLVYAKPRRGESAEALGLSVRWNLADRAVRLTNDEFDAGWSAYQVADHTWMLTFSFSSRQRAQQADWEVDLDEGELISRNRLASDLGFIEPGSRRRSTASLQPERPARSSSKDERRELPIITSRTTRPAVKKKAANKKKPGTKKAAPKKTAPKKTAPKKPAPKKTAPKKTAKRAKARKKAPVRKKAPARMALPAPVAAAPALPAVNELGQRRLQLVTGAGIGVGGATSGRRVGGRLEPGRPGARPAPAPERPPPRPFVPRERPVPEPPSEPEPEPGLDIVAAEPAGEDRRAERRRARAAARGSGDADARGFSPADDAADREHRDPVDGDPDDNRVVTIRANRATPPTGEGDAKLVLPPNRPPLRPAQPAAQPRKRGFRRASR